MTILIAVLHVRLPVIVVILTGAFYTVLISLTLNVLELLRRCIPATRRLSKLRSPVVPAMCLMPVP